MLTNQDEIRERIIQIRKERGLSQNQLAKDFGISRTHYSNVFWKFQSLLLIGSVITPFLFGFE